MNRIRNEIMKSDKIKSIMKPGMDYRFENGTFFIKKEFYTLNESAGKGLLGKVQAALKTRGAVYYFLISVFSPVLGSAVFRKKLNILLNEFNSEHIIVNVGSGPVYLQRRKDIINTDIFPFDEVDIVTHTDGLPFSDKSVDMITSVRLKLV